MNSSGLYRLISISTVFLFLAGGHGCGGSGASSGGGGSGTGSGDAIGDMLATFNTVAEVVSTSLSVAAPGGISGEQHVHCSNGVQATVTGSVGSGAFDTSVDFGGCDDVSGTAAVSGTYSDSGNNREFLAGLSNSAVGNGCTLELGGLIYDFTTAIDVISAPTSELATGSMTAACSEPDGSATVSCSFGTGVISNNTTLMRAACSCSGAGC